MRPVWLEIDLGAIARNLGEVKRCIGPHVQIMAIVMSDGYGYGALQVSRSLLHSGESRLGVATVGEGLQLRDRGL